MPAEGLAERASSAGQSWASEVRAALARDGRRATGMWPGTLSEARALAERVIGAAPHGPASREQREEVARTLYAAARKSWLKAREADPSDAP